MKHEICLLSEGLAPQALAVFAALDYDSTLDADAFARLTTGDTTSLQSLRLAAISGTAMTGFAVGCVRDDALVVKFLAVDPHWQRRGIGSALLHRLEDEARSMGLSRATVGGVGPNYFYPGVDLRLTPALSFLWRHGYETDRVARVDMHVDLATTDLATTEAERAYALQGITIRRMAAVDVDAVAALGAMQSTAFATEVRVAAENHPVSAFVALDGVRPVAFAVYGVTGKNRFGPTYTHPEHRRRGLGRLLLRLCLRDLRDQGWQDAEISWAGPVDYYARAIGAVVHKAYWVFTKQLDSAVGRQT